MDPFRNRERPLSVCGLSWHGYRSAVGRVGPAILVAAIALGCGGTGDRGDLGGGAGDASSGPSGADAGRSLGGGDAGTCSGNAPGCACATAGQTASCWTGPANMRNVGACHDGTAQCVMSGEFARWGPCTGQELVCGGGGGGGNEDSGGPGSGGGGSEDSGGSGGGGFEDAAPPPFPPLCTDPILNVEPELQVAYFPGQGQTVGLNGQIKVWLNDECPPLIAPGEQVDPTTGAITPGNRSATAPDGMLYEPALYLAPDTPQNGGTPHFPQQIKGDYNMGPGYRGSCQITNGSGLYHGPPIDTPPPGTNVTQPFPWPVAYLLEDVWDVSALGLAPGSYTGVFVVMDGDGDRSIGCINIVVTP
jgi:hypothetical protein